MNVRVRKKNGKSFGFRFEFRNGKFINWNYKRFGKNLLTLIVNFLMVGALSGLIAWGFVNEICDGVWR